MALEAGQVIQGKYRITRLLGEGGMGAVYAGENVRIHRTVAIKVLHAAFAENEEVVKRFEREAQAAGHIGNDHVMEVLDLGQLESGDLFLVMEYLDGEALSNRVERLGRMTPDQLAPLLGEVLEGLGAAHGAGIVHRDLKPDNIFILKEKAGQKDFVKIIDFGISKFQEMSGDGLSMTKTGTMMGTPYYMSPEQATGSREVDARSDIYAIGVIIYECLTGHVPFDAPTFNQLLFQIALTEPPPLVQVIPDIDSAFASIVGKAMAREPDARFQSCAEFAEAIEAWSKDHVGVSVPPAASEEEMRASAVLGVLPQSAAISRQTPGPDGKATGGNWSTSPDEPRGIGAKQISILAAAGFLLVGGAVFALSSGEPNESDAAAPPASEAAPAASSPPITADVPAEPAETAAAEPEKVEPAKPAAEDAGAKPTSAAESPSDEPKPAVRAPAPIRRAHRPSPPRPAPKPAAAAPAPAPKPKAAIGDDDFGY